MRQRIFGIETEYSIADPKGPARDLGRLAAEVLRTLAVTLGASTNNRWLRNGARAYVDLEHPEYAGPETNDPFDAAAADRAGDTLLAAGTAAVSAELGRPLHLIKNNLDSAGNSFGCHENYLVERSIAYPDYCRALEALLVTRPIVCGTGSPPRADGQEGFMLSQRAWQMFTLCAAGSTRDRPLILARDEPHSDSSRWRRMQILCGDSNLSERSTALKLGIVGLFLGAYETDPSAWDDRWRPDNLVGALRSVACDLTGRGAYRTRDGRTVTALNVQSWHYERLRDLYQRRGPLAWEQRVLDLWEDTLTALEAGPEHLVGRVEWATKYQLLESHRSSHEGLGWESPALAARDLMFHKVGRASPWERLEASGAAERVLDARQVTAACLAPPSKNRAQIRAQFINALVATSSTGSVDWQSVTWERRGGREQVSLPDPFQNRSYKVAAIVDQLSDRAIHRPLSEAGILAQLGV